MYLPLLFLLFLFGRVSSAPVHGNITSSDPGLASRQVRTNLSPSTAALPYTLDVATSPTVLDSTHRVTASVVPRGKDTYAPLSADAPPEPSGIPITHPIIGETVWFFALFIAVNVALIWVVCRFCGLKQQPNLGGNTPVRAVPRRPGVTMPVAGRMPLRRKPDNLRAQTGSKK